VDLPPSPSDYALSHAYLTVSHAESLGRPSVALLVIEERRLLAGGPSCAIVSRLGLSSKTSREPWATAPRVLQAGQAITTDRSVTR
jgi:hypothetical protein